MSTKKISLDFGGMTGKQVEDMAAGTLQQGGYVEVAPDTGEVIGGLWTLMAPTQVARETLSVQAARKEVFDFHTNTRTLICIDLERGGTPQVTVESFGDIGKEMVEKARKNLKLLTGASAARKPPAP